MRKNRYQYIVSIAGKKNRYDFINYIKTNYKLKFRFTEDYMAESHFPFIVDFNKKDFWVCESITCCACAAQNGMIISFEQFKELML